MIILFFYYIKFLPAKQLNSEKVAIINMPVVFGVINMSPESFYSPSVCKSVGEAVKRAEKMVEEGAEVVDIGGMSTAPYKNTWVSEEVEIKRVIPVIKELSKRGIKTSIDTTRERVAEEAIVSGCEIVNAVLPSEGIAEVVKRYGVPAIVVAREIEWKENVKSIVSSCIESLKRDLKLFRGCKTIADPAIGFWRKGNWWVRDFTILANLAEIKREVNREIMIGVSRKSFIGAVTNSKPEERLAGSVIAEVLSSPDYVRTHCVKDTVQAFKVAEYINKFKSK